MYLCKSEKLFLFRWICVNSLILTFNILVVKFVVFNIVVNGREQERRMCFDALYLRMHMHSLKVSVLCSDSRYVRCLNFSLINIQL